MSESAPITVACHCANCRHYESDWPRAASECHPCHVSGSFVTHPRSAQFWPAPDFGCVHASPNEALVAMLGEVKP